jgi:malonyl-CoA/methylmalonyl-CoA synthetase
MSSAPILDEDRDGAAMIAYTSGTTGVPKGALLSRANLVAGARALVGAWEWTAQDVLIHALPMFHMHGLGAGLNGTFTAGSSLIVLPRFDVDDIIGVLENENPTMFFGVPTMYARFAEHGKLSHLSRLRLIVSGSAPLDPVLFQAISSESGQHPVERYGMSETVMLTSNPLRGQRKPGSVGVPLPGVVVRLGEGDGVEVRGPNVFSGYWNRPEVNAFTVDGWFRTGDVGRFDEDGYLYLIGRASDLIITGGYNVYPREVEDVIRDIPGIADVAVVGIPDDTWGERVVAFYVSHLRADVDEELAGELLTSTLASFKHPRRWVRVTELPRNAMGKVRRDVLREQG